jgi:nitroreductase
LRVALSDQAVRHLFEHGALAPSGDNLQPWLVNVSGDTITLTVDPARDRSLYNFRYRASLIALGAMAENMVIAGREIGLSGSVAVGGAEPLPPVTIEFSRRDVAPDPLFPSLRLRCTNRKPFSPEPLPADVLASIAAALPGDDRSSLQFVTDRGRMKTLAQAAAMNDRLLFEWRELHGTFFESVRWTKAEADAAKDGLYVKTLELGPMESGFRAMSRWSIASIATRLGSGALAPRHSYQTFMRSGASGFLQVDGSSSEALVEGGRRLQRVWLAATSAGLSFQPMAGMLYLAQHLDAPAEPVPTSARARIALAYARFSMAIEPRDGWYPVMLFRVGYGPRPSARSKRRMIPQASPSLPIS